MGGFKTFWHHNNTYEYIDLIQHYPDGEYPTWIGLAFVCQELGDMYHFHKCLLDNMLLVKTFVFIKSYLLSFFLLSFSLIFVQKLTPKTNNIFCSHATEEVFYHSFTIWTLWTLWWMWNLPTHGRLLNRTIGFFQMKTNQTLSFVMGRGSQFPRIHEVFRALLFIEEELHRRAVLVFPFFYASNLVPSARNLSIYELSIHLPLSANGKPYLSSM